MLDPSGDTPVGEVGVRELSDTAEGEGSLLGLDEQPTQSPRQQQPVSERRTTFFASPGDSSEEEVAHKTQPVKLSELDRRLQGIQPPAPLTTRTQDVGLRRGQPNSEADTPAHLSYSHSNSWDLKDFDGAYYGEADSISSTSLTDSHKPKPHSSNAGIPVINGEYPNLGSSEDSNTPHWEQELRKKHTRGASTETQQEREAFANELAQRQRAIQESLRNKVDSDNSRSASPAPAVGSIRNAPERLRYKSSRDSMATGSRQLALQVRQHGLDILESYPQPSYKAGVVLIPEDKRDSVDITGIGAQSSLAGIAQGLNLLRDDASNIESPRLTHVSTHIVESKRSSISTFITAPSFRSSVATFQTANSGLRSIGGESATSRSSWYKLLKSENLIPGPLDEKNWSGRGEHAEFKQNEWPKIQELLPVEGLLGNSATAVVESVRCRRVLLARKTIRCNRRMKRTDALKEVQHLKKLEHSHIIQVVGTYIFRQDLAILLYPAAEYNLETFMESIIAESPGREGFLDKEETEPKLRAISTFFGCLAHAISFIHHNATKHMDIKPKNLLIKDMRHNLSQGPYKIYIADFGITRSYKRAADAETDSPTSFTRMYAAPEVTDQRRRGLSADIFSLGCCFAEMLAVLADTDRELKREDLLNIISSNEDLPRSYQSNLPLVTQWLEEIGALNTNNIHFIEFSLRPYRVKTMIHPDPASRPSAERVASWFEVSSPCCTMVNGPDPFSIHKMIEEGHEDERNNETEDAFGETKAQGTSLFQVCVNLRKQLRRIRPWCQQYMPWPIPDPYDDERLLVIPKLWAVFRLGFPLIALYNLLSPTVPPIDSEKVQEGEKCRNATHLFLQTYMTQFRLPVSECFTLTHMYNANIFGFVKVTKVVSHILGLLYERSVLDFEPLDDRDNKTDSTATTMTLSRRGLPHNSISHEFRRTLSIRRLVDKFVNAERQYVHDLETLYSLKELIEEQGVLVGESFIISNDIHEIFCNLGAILDLHYYLLMHFERMGAQTEVVQDWGKPFNLLQNSFDAYIPYILARRSSVKLVKRNFHKFAVVRGGPELRSLSERRSSLISFLLKPSRRLIKYQLFLQEILDSSQFESKKKSVSAAINAISGIIKRARFSCKDPKLPHGADNLMPPLEDSNSQDRKYLGDILLSGTFTISVGHGRAEHKCEIYLFEHILLARKEGSSRMISNSIINLKTPWSIGVAGQQGSICMHDVTGTAFVKNPGSYKLRILFGGVTSVRDLTIHFTTLEMAKRFDAQIDHIFSIYAAPAWPIGWNVPMLRASRASLPQPVNLKIICYNGCIIRIRVVRLNFNYVALKNYIEEEFNSSRHGSYILKHFGSEPPFINSDEDLERVFEDWFKQVEREEGPHNVELQYERADTRRY